MRSSPTLGVNNRNVLASPWRVGLAVLVLGAIAGLAGCGGEVGEQFYSVTGKVTYQGNVVPRGSVQLKPDRTKGNQSDHNPTGTIEEGSFKVYTAAREGAPAGWYKVVIIATEEARPGKGAAPGLPQTIIPESYKKPETTPLVMEVKAEATPQTHTFDLVGKIGGGGGTR